MNKKEKESSHKASSHKKIVETQKKERTGLFSHLSTRTIITIAIFSLALIISWVVFQIYKNQINIHAMPLGELMDDTVDPETGLYQTDNSAAGSAASAGAAAAGVAAGGGELGGESETGITGTYNSSLKSMKITVKCNCLGEWLGFLPDWFQTMVNPFCGIVCAFTKAFVDILEIVENLFLATIKI